MQVGSSHFETSGNEMSPTAANGGPLTSLGGSITVQIWYFDISRIHCVAERCSPPFSMSDHGWSFLLWAGEMVWLVWYSYTSTAGAFNYLHPPCCQTMNAFRWKKRFRPTSNQLQKKSSFNITSPLASQVEQIHIKFTKRGGLGLLRH